MMYHYASLDGIEIVYTEPQGHGIVTVYCERPDPEAGAQFALPGCTCVAASGFFEVEVQRLKQFIREHQEDILQRAEQRPREELGERLGEELES